jgi:hypothetical protein
MARFKAQGQDVNAKVHAAMQTILKNIAPRLATVETVVGNTEAERHFAALHTAHADFDVVVPKVAEWIKAQPAYLRSAMQAVYDGGTTQDVLALVADYKRATGTAADPAAEAAAKAAAEAAAKGRKKDGTADLEPVGSRRTTAAARGAPDKNDLDGAWEELTAATK